MLHEISRRTIHLTKYEDIDIVWHNNVLTVRCDSGLHLFNFSYNLKCLDKNIDFIETKIMTSKSSPAAEFFPKNAFKCGMKNMELSEMVLDPSLWPHNKHLMEVAIIIAFEWSPIDIIHNNESVLATVNSAGNIDLYAQDRHKWTKLENLSFKLKRELESKIPNLIPSISYDGPINFKNAKLAAYAIETSSICWCPILNADKSCNFVTAQKNGYILFWLINCQNKSADALLLYHISENIDEIVRMKWIPISVNKFILICSNVLGQILAYQCQIINNMLEVISTHFLWSFKDKMIADYIECEDLDDNIFVSCNKHRHLLSLIIDKNCSVLFQNVKNVNDQRITAVVKSNKKFYTSTVNRELYEIKYAIENKSLEVHLVPIEFKGIPPVSELYSFAFSSNDILLALALLDRTILCRKMPLKLEIVFYTEEKPNLELNTIINNPTKTLTNVWDSIESLRCKSLKSKGLPQFDYNKLYSDAKDDNFYGKVFLIFLTFYNNLEITVQNSTRDILPETSVYVVKSNILACHAVQVIRKLSKKFNDVMTENIVDKFGFECLRMAHLYLKEFCNKKKMKLNDLLPSDIVEMLQKVHGPEYICQWCDKVLNGFTCADGHLNSFCSLSFTPIESNDYLICRSCGTTARSELCLDKPKCVFCELYLCNCYLPS